MTILGSLVICYGTTTTVLPFECAVYFAQHILLLLVPVALLDMKSVFSVEPLDDISWSVFSLSLQVMYHFLVLQPLSVVTGINLNHMLCPAVTDPFEGPHYRLVAMVHQPALILILGKCITCFSLRWFGQPLPWQNAPAIETPNTQLKRPERASDATGLLDSWLDANSEPSTMAIDAASWCWSDLFRYQTYWFDWRAITYRTTSRNEPIVGSSTVTLDTSNKSL
ncbi:Transmembrane protein [Fasciola gigantica]|uniref:Transmembrane protein n=1 Tax=Fasciola gigantica TaxID=46835 RepID=A0A504YQL2_FASGI|nr:Transmembrane protein [Fasciola gigantica]